MKNQLISQQEKILNIIAESFDSNPSVNWVVKNDKKRKKRIKELARYSYITSFARNGVFISSDKTGVALCYKYNEKRETIRDYWNQLRLVIKAIGLNRVFEVLKRESYIKSKRPKSGDFLYFWFFGVEENGRGKTAAKELKEIIFKESNIKKLPIYLETSVEKNMKVYQRYGFELYHTWKVESQGINLWFMKREPK